MNNRSAKPLAGLITALLLLVAGCQTSSVDDLGVTAPQSTQATQVLPDSAPTATAQPTPLNTALAASAPTNAGHKATERARKTGAYPKIGHTQDGQTAQLTSADKTTLHSDLRNARKAASERSLGENFTKYQVELQSLRKTAKEHGKKSREKEDELTDAQKELKRLREMRLNHGKNAIKKIEKPTS